MAAIIYLSGCVFSFFIMYIINYFTKENSEYKTSYEKAIVISIFSYFGLAVLLLIHTLYFIAKNCNSFAEKFENPRKVHEKPKQ